MRVCRRLRSDDNRVSWRRNTSRTCSLCRRVDTTSCDLCLSLTDAGAARQSTLSGRLVKYCDRGDGCDGVTRGIRHSQRPRPSPILAPRYALALPSSSQLFIRRHLSQLTKDARDSGKERVRCGPDGVNQASSTRDTLALFRLLPNVADDNAGGDTVSAWLARPFTKLGPAAGGF